MPGKHSREQRQKRKKKQRKKRLEQTMPRERIRAEQAPDLRRRVMEQRPLPPNPMDAPLMMDELVRAPSGNLPAEASEPGEPIGLDNVDVEIDPPAVEDDAKDIVDLGDL